LLSVPGKRRGVNRVDWAMRIAAPKTAPGASLVPNLYSLMGPRVPAGTYTVKMIKGKETFTSTITLQHDPRSTHGADDRALQRKTVMKLYAMVERLATLIDDVKELSNVYQQISDELSSQYTVGYTSKNPRRDGTWRRIIVRIERPGLTVRTKQGYYAPTGP